jgi:hypothetical protein
MMTFLLFSLLPAKVSYTTYIVIDQNKQDQQGFHRKLLHMNGEIESAFLSLVSSWLISGLLIASLLLIMTTRYKPKRFHAPQK